MKVLYITDIDGTLLNNDGKLSEYTIKTINELIKKGMFFSYATVRSLLTLSIVTKGINVNVPVITKNGIFIEDLNLKEVLYSIKFTDDEKSFIIDALKQFSVYPIVYSFIDGIEKKSWIHNKENDAIKREVESWYKNNDPRIRSVNTEVELFKGEIFHFNCLGKEDELIDLYKYINSTANFHCMLRKDYYLDDYFIEIMPKKANKGNTILKLKEIMNFDKIISFGDAKIDIPMFRISDECYAVENAEDELKKIATGIIKSNNNDGVANWLENNYKT